MTFAASIDGLLVAVGRTLDELEKNTRGFKQDRIKIESLHSDLYDVVIRHGGWSEQVTQFLKTTGAKQ